MYLSRRELIGAAALAGLGLAELDHLPPAQLRALREAVRGRVLTPSNRGDDAARRAGRGRVGGRVLPPPTGGAGGARLFFTRRYDGIKPPAVVQVRDVADVRAVVRWAARFDVPLTTRSGGHAYNGSSTGRHVVV